MSPFRLTCWLLIFMAATILNLETVMGSERIVFSSDASGNWDFWSVQADGTGLKQITQTPDEDELFPSVSPDLKEIVYANGKRILHTLNMDGTHKKAIPMPVGIYAHPTWSPDGNGIAFVRYTVIPSDQSEIWTIQRKDGEWKDPERLTSHPPMRLYPSYSPDGLKLAFTEFRRDPYLGVVEEIGILDTKTNESRVITNDNADSHQAVWSPKGDMLAYTSNKSGNYDIWIISLTNETHRQLTKSGYYDGEPEWSPDGAEIAFVSTRTGNKEIWAISVIGDRLRQITKMKKTCIHPFWM